MRDMSHLNDRATNHLPPVAPASLASPVDQRQPYHTWFAEHGQNNVYFVLGVQGSGTNLVVRVLQSTFGFSAVLDNSLIFDAAVRVEQRPTKKVVIREFSYVVNNLFPNSLRRRVAWKHYHHRSAGFAGIDQHFDPSMIECGADFARFFYGYHAWTLGCRHMLVKSDDLWQNIEYLNALFPDRRCVLLIRDPRDNALSVSRKEFGPCDLFRAAQYTDRQLRIYRHEAACRSAETLPVKYEMLLGDPIRFVSAFAAQFGFCVPEDVEERLEQLKIRSDNSQKWRKLSPTDLAACEWVLQPHLQDLDYPLSGHLPARPPLVERVRRFCIDLKRRASQKGGRIVESLKDASAGVAS